MPLVAVMGPSGAGKTTCIDEICSSHRQHQMVTCHTTRTNRHQGEAKISLPQSTFQENSDQGEYSLVTGLFGHRYGMLRSDIEAALATTSQAFWIDFPTQELTVLERWGGSQFRIMLDVSHDVLADRLNSAGRSDRVGQAFAQLDSCKRLIRKNPEYFNLVIETSDLTPRQVRSEVMASLVREFPNLQED